MEEELNFQSDNYFTRVIRRISDHQKIGTVEELVALFLRFKPYINPNNLQVMEKVLGIRNQKTEKKRQNFGRQGGGGGGEDSDVINTSKLHYKNLYAAAKTNVSHYIYIEHLIIYLYRVLYYFL